MSDGLFLRHPYISIVTGSGRSYGGSQEWFERGTLKRYGCGAIALCDVLLYITENHETYASLPVPESEEEKGIYKKDAYLRFVRKMNRLYIHVIPGVGIPGSFLSLAANAVFKLKKMPYRASFHLSGKNLQKKVEASIKEDMPVMLAAGKGLRFWQKRELPLYRLRKGEYKKAASTRGHMVVVTGLTDGYFQISSWGRKYYIPISEYLDYCGSYSSFLISNICTVKKKDGKNKKKR